MHRVGQPSICWVGQPSRLTSETLVLRDLISCSVVGKPPWQFPRKRKARFKLNGFQLPLEWCVFDAFFQCSKDHALLNNTYTKSQSIGHYCKQGVKGICKRSLFPSLLSPFLPFSLSLYIWPFERNLVLRRIIPAKAGIHEDASFQRKPESTKAHHSRESRNPTFELLILNRNQ